MIESYFPDFTKEIPILAGLNGMFNRYIPVMSLGRGIKFVAQYSFERWYS